MCENDNNTLLFRLSKYKDKKNGKKSMANKIIYAKTAYVTLSATTH